MLELEELERSENGTCILGGVTARFAPGKLYAVLGRTGAGKTSLMKAIAGMQALDGGTVRHNGEDWAKRPPWKRAVAMVYQQFINYPHLSALDNVAFPLVRRGLRRREARERARRELERVGLGSMVDRRPSQLSGGQQQRVAIARALVKDAPILLLDEPFVNLDYKLREQFREELVGLLGAETGTVALYATTEPREALQLGDEVLLFHEGRLLEQGEPRALFAAPSTVEAARVLSDPPMNLLPIEVRAGAGNLGSLGAVGEGTRIAELPDGRYHLGLRAGDLSVGGELSGEVVLTEVSGSETITHLDTGDHELVLQEKSVVRHEVGTRVHFQPHWEAALVFGEDGRLLHGRREGGHG